MCTRHKVASNEAHQNLPICEQHEVMNGSWPCRLLPTRALVQTRRFAVWIPAGPSKSMGKSIRSGWMSFIRWAQASTLITTTTPTCSATAVHTSGAMRARTSLSRRGSQGWRKESGPFWKEVSKKEVPREAFGFSKWLLPTGKPTGRTNTLWGSLGFLTVSLGFLFDRSFFGVPSPL